MNRRCLEAWGRKDPVAAPSLHNEVKLRVSLILEAVCGQGPWTECRPFPGADVLHPTSNQRCDSLYFFLTAAVAWAMRLSTSTRELPREEQFGGAGDVPDSCTEEQSESKLAVLLFVLAPFALAAWSGIGLLVYRLVT
jgi:hypothetical protein